MRFWRTETSLLRRYLLDECSEERAAALDERLLADASFYERLLVAEDELIEAFLADELSVDRQQRFEALFLGSAERRARVELARDLMTAAHRTDLPEPEAESTRSAWSFLTGLDLGSHTFSAAVAFVLLVGLGLVVQSQRSPTGQGPSMASSIAQIALFPAVRSAATVPRLELTSEAEFVELQTVVHGAQEYQVLRARLETRRGALLWQSTEIEPEQGASSIDWRVAADLLPTPSDPDARAFYVLRVEGADSLEEYQLLDEYEFEVARIP